LSDAGVLNCYTRVRVQAVHGWHG